MEPETRLQVQQRWKETTYPQNRSKFGIQNSEHKSKCLFSFCTEFFFFLINGQIERIVVSHFWSKFLPYNDIVNMCMFVRFELSKRMNFMHPKPISAPASTSVSQIIAILHILFVRCHTRPETHFPSNLKIEFRFFFRLQAWSKFLFRNR